MTEGEGGDEKEQEQNQGTTKGNKSRQQRKTNTTPKTPHNAVIHVIMTENSKSLRVQG
jgi:hypothetical protein